MFATIMTVLTFVVVLVFSVQPLFVSKGRSRSSYKMTAEALDCVNFHCTSRSRS